MKQLIINMLKLAIKRLGEDDCMVPDDTALRILEIGERMNSSNEPLSKTEVADLLHCSTKTVERHIHDGLLCKGRKKPGHNTLYWKLEDVLQCRKKLM